MGVLSYYAECLLKPWALLAGLGGGMYCLNAASFIHGWASLVAVAGVLFCVYAFLAYHILIEQQRREEIRDLIKITIRKIAPGIL